MLEVMPGLRCPQTKSSNHPWTSTTGTAYDMQATEADRRRQTDMQATHVRPYLQRKAMQRRGAEEWHMLVIISPMRSPRTYLGAC